MRTKRILVGNMITSEIALLVSASSHQRHYVWKMASQIRKAKCVLRYYNSESLVTIHRGLRMEFGTEPRMKMSIILVVCVFKLLRCESACKGVQCLVRN